VLRVLCGNLGTHEGSGGGLEPRRAHSGNTAFCWLEGASWAVRGSSLLTLSEVSAPEGRDLCIARSHTPRAVQGMGGTIGKLGDRRATVVREEGLVSTCKSASTEVPGTSSIVTAPRLSTQNLTLAWSHLGPAVSLPLLELSLSVTSHNGGPRFPERLADRFGKPPALHQDFARVTCTPDSSAACDPGLANQDTASL
jgi:hypothetical protein